MTAPDGRTLGVVEAGDPAGAPVLVHSGSPASRLLYRRHVEDAEASGIRLIGYDRPGFGRSSRHPGRTVADAAADVEAIADALGIERLVSWGISGGGPHVLACAALLPDRVAAVASLAGVAPFDAEGLDWFAGMGEENIDEYTRAAEDPDTVEPTLRGWAQGMLAGGPESVAEGIRSLLSPVDAAAMTGELGEHVFESMREAIGDHVEGWVDDDLAFVSPWGFALADIRVPVLLWHGLEDRFVPTAHGEWLAAHIPGVEAHISPEDGHLTLEELRVPGVHAWLVERL